MAGRDTDTRGVRADEAQGGTRSDAGANRRSSQQDSLGPSQMELSLGASRLVDAGLKNLAQLRVATLIGCPF